MEEVTPGWRLVFIGVDGAIPAWGDFDPWKVKWRAVPPTTITVAHPSYPSQRHKMWTYELDGPEGAIRFAAGEFSNGIWGVFVPDDERPTLMVVRTALSAPTRERANESLDRLCTYARRWGVCRVLRSEPFFEVPGDWKMDFEVRLSEPSSVSSLLSETTHSLASGPWEIRDIGPDDSFAVWDKRRGGRALQDEISWLCVEFMRCTLPMPNK